MFDMMNDTRRAYRQGDVLLVPCAGIPADACEEAPEGGRVILAHGERTGHCHAMAADRVRHFLQKDGPAPSGWSAVEEFAPVRKVRSRQDCVMLPFRALAQAVRV